MGKGIKPFRRSWPFSLGGSACWPHSLLQFLLSSTTDRPQMEFGLLAILNTDVWSFQCQHLGCLGGHSGDMDGTRVWESRLGSPLYSDPGYPQTGPFLALTLFSFTCKTRRLGLHEPSLLWGGGFFFSLQQSFTRLFKRGNVSDHCQGQRHF